MKAHRFSISGIYPHLAAWNTCTDPASPWFGHQEPECGIGAVVPWAGKLWFLTYTSHALGEGSDKLYAVSPDKSVEVRSESVGGTHACRMIHRPSNQLFIGCYAIDEQGSVRVIDRKKMPGRLSSIATHLTDPANKLCYYTQECSLYELDVHTLEATLRFVKAVPGWHSKGAYTAQGVLVVSHNGEEPGPSPFWQVDYSNLPKTIKEVEQHLQTPITYGPEDWGVLAEWSGTEWKVVSRRQHNDVMGPGGDGIASSANPDEPIWAQGWDRRSVLLNVRHAGQWRTYRLPKGSYTYDGWNGSYTEWPRFRGIGDGRWLMCMHGTFFEWPSGFRSGRTSGLYPLCTYQRYIPDFCRWGDELVLAGQDASRIGVPWAAPGHPHSNLQFIHPGTLETWGPRAGYGGVWRDDAVEADVPSDPFLVAGYEEGCLHLSHEATGSVTFTIEADANGDDVWREVARVEVIDYRSFCFAPARLNALWLRLRVNQAVRGSAYFHLGSARKAVSGEERVFAGLAGARPPEALSGGILRVPVHNHNLAFLARTFDASGAMGPEAYYEIDETLAFHRIDDASLADDVRATSAIEPHVFEEAASWVATGADGRRFRLPKSPHGHVGIVQRDVREILQERSLANVGGTFYEVPRYGVAEPYEQRNLPDYSRMRPISSHAATITDFCIWRGLLILSGVRADAAPHGHVFCAPDGGAALWFGAFDDLWKLGRPVGVGGPWLDTPVRAGEPSDPYLMTGFNRKVLQLSHRNRKSVNFRVEVDFTADGRFHPYAELAVASGETVTHEFPVGFHAHWVRLVSEMSTVATARLVYT